MKVQAAITSPEPVTIQPFDSLVVDAEYDRAEGQYTVRVFLHGRVIAAAVRRVER